MELFITDSKTISQIQKEFSDEFPYLKLEFVELPVRIEKIHAKFKIHSADKKLLAIRKMRNEGTITLTGSVTVKELETIFWESYGLAVQIFRKSGNVWIETSLTDLWTLDRQNREGMEMSSSDKTTDTIDPE